MGAKLMRGKLWWLILCVKSARLRYPVVWSNLRLDIAVKAFFLDVANV